MHLIKASAEIRRATEDMELIIEEAIRVCYKSEDRICEGSAEKIIRDIMDKHHESTIEHAAITVKFINDRGISHEEVRHRISSFSQESTRYCNYSKDKFDNELNIIDIRGGYPEQPKERFDVWMEAMLDAERHYLKMIELGATPGEARSVLPNSLKTELFWTANPREWRHIFKLRTSNAAHPQIVEVMLPLLKEFKNRWPVLFGDIEPGSKWVNYFKE